MADALIITLVAEGALLPGDASAASDVVRGIGAEIVAQSWLEAGDAYDILARGDATAIQAGLPGLSDVNGDTIADWTYRTFRAPGTTTTIPKAFLRAKVITSP
jgi:hypothetical protein